MESVEFGRIAAQTAKQVIVQKVREAEREQVVEEYKEREGEMLSGLVKRVDRNGVYIDLGGNAEGFVAREQMVPREPVRPQDQDEGATGRKFGSEQRGPQLFMTRTSPQFLVELFKIEVPEVGQGLIDILGSARDPGIARQDCRQRVMTHVSTRSVPASACAVRVYRRSPMNSRVSVSTSFCGMKILLSSW